MPRTGRRMGAATKPVVYARNTSHHGCLAFVASSSTGTTPYLGISTRILLFHCGWLSPGGPSQYGHRIASAVLTGHRMPAVTAAKGYIAGMEVLLGFH